MYVCVYVCVRVKAKWLLTLLFVREGKGMGESVLTKIQEIITTDGLAKLEG
jgi:hypothetical protein